MSSSEETAKAYAQSKAGILRIIELILAIIISVIISFYHEGLRHNYFWAFIIHLCMIACFIMIIVSLVLHCCGKECPCEFWFCVFGACVYFAWGICLIIIVLRWDRGADSIWVGAVEDQDLLNQRKPRNPKLNYVEVNSAVIM